MMKAEDAVAVLAVAYAAHCPAQAEMPDPQQDTPAYRLPVSETFGKSGSGEMIYFFTYASGERTERAVGDTAAPRDRAPEACVAVV